MTATNYPPLQSLLAREAIYLLCAIDRKRHLLGAEAADLDHAIESMRLAVAQEDESFNAHVRGLLARDEYEAATGAVAGWMDAEISHA